MEEEEEEEEEVGGGGGTKTPHTEILRVYKGTPGTPEGVLPAALVAGVSRAPGRRSEPPRPAALLNRRGSSRGVRTPPREARGGRRGRHAHDRLPPPSNSRASVTAEATTTRRNERRPSCARVRDESPRGRRRQPPSFLPGRTLPLRSPRRRRRADFSHLLRARSVHGVARPAPRRVARFSRFTAAVCVGTGLGAATFRRGGGGVGFVRAADGRGAARTRRRSHRRGGRGRLRVARRGDGEARAVEANDRPRRNDDARGGRRRRRVPRGRGRGRRRPGLRRGRDVEDDSDDSERIIRGDVR